MPPTPLKSEIHAFALVALTWPEEVPSEAEALERMARYPFRAIHLRKPGWNKERTEQLLQQLSPACRAKIRLHDHLELVKEYGLQGYHLNQRNRQAFLQIEKDATIIIKTIISDIMTFSIFIIRKNAALFVSHVIARIG